METNDIPPNKKLLCWAVGGFCVLHCVVHVCVTVTCQCRWTRGSRTVDHFYPKFPRQHSATSSKHLLTPRECPYAGRKVTESVNISYGHLLQWRHTWFTSDLKRIKIFCHVKEGLWRGIWRIGRNETEDGVSLNKPYTFWICGDKSQLKGFLIFLDNIISAARMNR